MQFWTTATPDQVLQMAAQTLAANKYEVAFGPGIVSGSRKDKANWFVAIVLLLLMLAPGIVYLVLAGKRRSASLTAVAQDAYTLVTTTGEPKLWKSLRHRIEYHAPATA